MTPEARKYLIELYRRDPGIFFEFEEDPYMGITKCVINQSCLEEDELNYVWNLIHNGNAKIVIEWRDPNYYPESRLFNISNKNELPEDWNKFSENCSNATSGVIIRSKNGEKFIFKSAFEGMTEKQLSKKLKEAEAAENYEKCIEIQKYAESKGWDLK